MNHYETQNENYVYENYSERPEENEIELQNRILKRLDNIEDNVTIANNVKPKEVREGFKKKLIEFFIKGWVGVSGGGQILLKKIKKRL